MRGQPNTLKDEALVTLWINDRYLGVLQGLEESLRSAGFGVCTKAGNFDIAAHISVGGEPRGIVDVTKLLMDIATTDDLNYDSRLADPAYETAKIWRFIGDRVEALKALFGEGGATMDRLQELSRKSKIRLTVIRPVG